MQYSRSPSASQELLQSKLECLMISREKRRVMLWLKDWCNSHFLALFNKTAQTTGFTDFGYASLFCRAKTREAVAQHLRHIWYLRNGWAAMFTYQNKTWKRILYDAFITTKRQNTHYAQLWSTTFHSPHRTVWLFWLRIFGRFSESSGITTNSADKCYC